MAAVDENQVASVFLRELGAPDTPEMRKAVIAWLRKESGSNIIGANPWNISLSAAKGTGIPICDERTHSRTGQKFAVYCNVTDGTRAAAKLLQTGLRPGDTRGYAGVIESAKLGDPLRFLDSLARSKWSADRYGGPSNNSLLNVYKSVTGLRTLDVKAPIGVGKLPSATSELVGRANDLLAKAGIPTDPSHVITESEARSIASGLYNVDPDGRIGQAIVRDWVGKSVGDFTKASVETGDKFENSVFDQVADLIGTITDPGYWARVLALLAGIGLTTFGIYRLATS